MRVRSPGHHFEPACYDLCDFGEDVFNHQVRNDTRYDLKQKLGARLQVTEQEFLEVAVWRDLVEA